MVDKASRSFRSLAHSTFVGCAAGTFALWLGACSVDVTDGAGGNDSSGSGPNGTGMFQGSTSGFANGNGATNSTGSTGPESCADHAKVVYLVSVNRELIAFDPTKPGLSAYRLVGTLNCSSAGSPQSMSVDRAGTAYVFYDPGQLFVVSTLDASCQPTNYVHPVQQQFNQLGMGFTATTPDSEAETLFVVSPNFGLATVSIPSLAVSQLGVLNGAAELTGGIDGKLFHFEAASAQLNEIDRSGYAATPMHVFAGLEDTQAWAFSRYAGKFYMFTSPNVSVPTTTTEYDPVSGTQTVRDADIGYVIVGAGQSTCVPPPPPPL